MVYRHRLYNNPVQWSRPTLLSFVLSLRSFLQKTGSYMDIYDLFQNSKISILENKLDSVERSNRFENQNLFEEATKKMNQLVLLNQAISEILIEKLGITNKEILDKMNDIDLRDGIKDGKYTKAAKDCPKCDAKINREFKRCLFCGYADDSPDDLPI